MTMHLDQLLMFISITLLVSASPGPVMLCCLFDASRYGFRQSCYSMLGASLGNLLLMLISALGLSLLITQANWIFLVIKWLGAAYLVYLGLMLIKTPRLGLSAHSGAGKSRQLVKKSFLIAATNPKGLVYFGALFPQFIDPQQPIAPQFALLTLIFLVLDLTWMLIYAKGGQAVMRWFHTERHQRWFSYGSGGVFILMGLALALSHS
jgi:homoserine/homoserine lactone efflux protein